MLGALVAVAGAAVSAVYVVQPWLACSSDDLSSACAMRPGDAAVLMAALLVALLGVATVSVALLATTRPSAMSGPQRVATFGFVPLCFVAAAAGVVYLF